MYLVFHGRKKVSKMGLKQHGGHPYSLLIDFLYSFNVFFTEILSFCLSLTLLLLSEEFLPVGICFCLVCS